MDTTRGRRMPGSTSAAPTTGRECAWMRSAGWCSCRPDRRPTVGRQGFTDQMVTQLSPSDRGAVLKNLRQRPSNGQFVPRRRQGIVILPGFDGGGVWGGAAFEATRGLLYVNANEMAWIIKL